MAGALTVPYRQRVIDVTAGPLTDGRFVIVALGVWDEGRHAYVALGFSRSGAFQDERLAIAEGIRIAKEAIDERRV